MNEETEEKIFKLLVEEEATATKTETDEEIQPPLHEERTVTTETTTQSDTASNRTTETKQESTSTPITSNETKSEEVEENTFVEWKKGHKNDCMCAVCKSRRKKAGEEEETKPTAKKKPTATAQPTQDARADLFGTLEGYKEVKPTNATTQPVMDASKFINGALFLIVMDAAFPLLFTTVLGMFDAKYKNIRDESKNKLKLTDKEKQLLEESANEMVKYLFAGANPIAVFAVSVGFIYYSKFEALQERDFYTPTPKKVL